MNSAWGAFGQRSACADRRIVFCVGEGRRLACSALEGRFQSARRPSADGRPARRMNSAWGGLWPTVGLRRPEDCLLRRRRPTLGAQRLEGPISIGTKAFGPRSACAPNEFGLGGPLADGRPAPTGELSFASAKADARRIAPWKADFHRHGGLRPAVGLRRPGRCLLRRRRPTLGAQRLGRPISIGTKAFGRRSACADREGVFCVGEGQRLACSALEGRFQSARRPSADGRPAPTGKVSFASAKANAWRAAPGGADFNRHEGLRPTVGLHAE